MLRDAWEATHSVEPDHKFTERNRLVAAENENWALGLGRRIDYVMVRCLEHSPTLDASVCAHLG